MTKNLLNNRQPSKLPPHIDTLLLAAAEQVGKLKVHI